MSSDWRDGLHDDDASLDLPETGVQLTGYLFRLLIDRKVIDSWPKTLRLAFLIGILPLLVIAVVAAFIVTIDHLKLDPQRWGLVAGSVVATVAGVRTLVWAARRRPNQSGQAPITDDVQTAEGTPATGEATPQDR